MEDARPTFESGEPPTFEPRPAQAAARGWIETRRRCALFLEPGLGKTATVLSALLDLDEPGSILVIAPRAPAMSTWPSEIARWGFPFRVRPLAVGASGRSLGRARRRKVYRECVEGEPAVCVATFDIVADLVAWFLDEAGSWPFPTVVVDESHRAKAWGTVRFSAMRRIAERATRIVELSGTPMPNGLLNLWSQMWLLDFGERLGRTVSAYRDRWFRSTASVNGIPVAYRPLPGAREEIFDRISDIVMSRRYDRPLDVEATRIDVEMGSEAERRYREFKRRMVMELDPDGSGDPRRVAAANRAVLQSKLLQMASGAIYDGGDGSSYEVVHEAKVRRVIDIVRSEDSPVMVAYHFKSDLDMLSRGLTAAGVDWMLMDGSPEACEIWNAGGRECALMQPASTGCGLNLQFGGHILIWYTLTWNLEEYLQANRRINRPGQSERVWIGHLVCERTIDSAVLARLISKNTDEHALLEALAHELGPTSEPGDERDRG